MKSQNTVEVKVPRKRDGYKAHKTTVRKRVLPELPAGAPTPDGARKPAMAGPEVLGLAPDAQEQCLGEWLLAQRLLHEVGQLEPDKVDALNERMPGWGAPVDEAELGHALEAGNPELDAALEAWWHAHNPAEDPLTVAELRAQAEQAYREEAAS